MAIFNACDIVARTVRLLTLMSILALPAAWSMLHATPAVAKFGDVVPLKGAVKCCFPQAGHLAGRCLEMSEQDCKIKQGKVVKDCRDCTEESKKKRK